ncbi:MAG: TRAM domain-containing protein, partial [Tissierellia bacterium]|nr:TRAM domain-containing protein [Tissierellia bacterium]
ELYNFIEEIKFDRLGVFTYSREEGTPAYDFNDHLEEDIKQYRKNQLMQLQQEISYSLNNQKVGKIFEVLIEDKLAEDLYLGRTYMDSPDIDGVVFVKTYRKLMHGQFIHVKIIEASEYDLIGEMVYESS